MAGSAFVCTPTAIYDGDGPIWCAEGPKVRLAGIAAREIDETCRPQHPCPKASGKASRDHLVKLLGGPRGTLPQAISKSLPTDALLSTGSAGGERTGAWCGRRVWGTCRVPWYAVGMRSDGTGIGYGMPAR
jgi:hypothetical protein